MSNDNERYMEWLREGQFTNITDRVNAAFSILEMEGRNTWFPLRDLPVRDPSDPEMWSWVED